MRSSGSHQGFPPWDEVISGAAYQPAKLGSMDKSRVASGRAEGAAVRMTDDYEPQIQISIYLAGRNLGEPRRHLWSSPMA